MDNFQIGDRVRGNPDVLAMNTPEWRKRVGVIARLEGPHPGQGERRFAWVRMVDNESILGPVSSDLLEFA